MLNLEDMISQVRAYRTSLLEVEVFALIQRGEIEVQSALRGLSRERLAHLYQSEITKTITSASPFIVLPGEAGQVLRAELDNKPIPVLSASHAAAATRNHLYSKCAVRRGSELQFYGLPEPQITNAAGSVGFTARVVYETCFERAVFLDGFYGRMSDYPYTDSGVSLPVVGVLFPEGHLFSHDSIKGATLRLYDNDHVARDYTVFKTFMGNPEEPPRESGEPVKQQRIVLNNDVTTISVNFPNFSKFGENGFPLRVTKVAYPPTIREAVVLWAKYEITEEPRFRQDYFNYLAQLGVAA
jgi:hypothetical protein